MRKRRSTTMALLLSICSLSACNSVTGVDDLTIAKPDGGPTPFIEPLITIPGLGITEISLYQGIKIPLMTGGKSAKSTLPVIAGRDALIRVFMTSDGTYNGDPVTGRIFIEGNPVPFEITAGGAPKASVEAELNTTLNFKIPGSAITTFTNYKLIIGKPSGPVPLPATSLYYPLTGYESLPAHSVGAGLKLVLVPVEYGADSSKRVPPTTEDVQSLYANGFRGMYPIPGISVTVHDPVPWSQIISNDGTGWPELLDHITMLRQTDKAPFDAYYFAIFQPAATFAQYCGSGCVLGLANLASSPSSSTDRAAIGAAYFEGVAFNGTMNADESIETALHEIGHTHGRAHSPSGGAAGPDLSYPYSDGTDGIWGYNLITNKLFEPANFDVMGYASPNWISDYTYDALYTRIKAVNMTMAKMDVPDELRDLTYDRILINQFGVMKWMPPVKMALPPVGEPQTVLLESRAGTETRTAQFFRWDHLDGGTLIWPSTGRSAEAIRFDYAGKSRRVTR